jgi:hypothetical protein
MTAAVPAATWVLMAILYGGGEQGATLRNIISAGDYLNHAILAYDELNSALAWLLAAGCVEARHERYFPSASVLAAYQAIERKYRSATKQWERLEEFLQTQPVSTPSTSAISLTEYTQALESYLR